MTTPAAEETAGDASGCWTPPKASRAERRRAWLCRGLLYGSPFAAAVAAASLRLLAPHLPPGWPAWSAGGVAVVGSGLLSAVGSAAGALWLPNRLALRVAHAASAAVVSFAVYWVLLTAAVSLPW